MTELTTHSNGVTSGVIDEEDLPKVLRAFGWGICEDKCNMKPLDEAKYIEGRPSSWSIEDARSYLANLLADGFTHSCSDCKELGKCENCGVNLRCCKE